MDLSVSFAIPDLNHVTTSFIPLLQKVASKALDDFLWKQFLTVYDADQ
jgi:hypothetical protein